MTCVSFSGPLKIPVPNHGTCTFCCDFVATAMTVKHKKADKVGVRCQRCSFSNLYLFFLVLAMLVPASLVSSVLLASAVLAIPSHNHMTRALHRRAGVPSQIHHRHETVTSSGSDIGYDLNWAGAIQDVDVVRQFHQPSLTRYILIYFSRVHSPLLWVP